jgi:hypothetical protein
MWPTVDIRMDDKPLLKHRLDSTTPAITSVVCVFLCKRRLKINGDRCMGTAFPIRIQIDGRWHEAVYSVNGDPRDVTVTCEYGSTTTQMGGLPAPLLARYLLSEFVTQKLRESAAATISAACSERTAVTGPGSAAESDIASGQDSENESEETTPGPGSDRAPDPVWPAQRWPGESAREFRAYCFYRNLGVYRSLQKAWREYCQSEPRVAGKLRGRPRRGGDVVTKCPGAWTALSRRYDWAKRTHQYDRLRNQEWDAARQRFLELQAFNSTAALFGSD